MKKGKKTYSKRFVFSLWLQFLIEIIPDLAGIVLCIWLVYKVSISDLPDWFKIFLLS